MSAATLTFAPDVHEYRRLTGERVPSVTEILRETGVSVDFAGLGGISKKLGDAIDLKRDLGKALHADAHSYDDDDLVWSTVDPLVLPYLDAWGIFRLNKGLKPMQRERLVYHQTLNYAGTLDGIFLDPAGRRILIDIKLGDPEDAGARYQLAGYWLAYECTHPSEQSQIDERWSVRLTPEHKVPYRITPYTEWRDFETWRAIVATYWVQAARRRTA